MNGVLFDLYNLLTIIQEWQDLRLRWDPHEFGMIEMTHLPSEELWRPDIILYNKYVNLILILTVFV